MQQTQSNRICKHQPTSLTNNSNTNDREISLEEHYLCIKESIAKLLEISNNIHRLKDTNISVNSFQLSNFQKKLKRI